jgi:uncharacterized membrane protein YhaH (DUF805 family)
MSSLADFPEVTGFFSYSRDDDEAFMGALSALRDGIQRELSAQLGRSRHDFRVWQDQQAIAPGTLWESEIKGAVAQSTFFIPIVTPRAVNSKYCGFEFNAFLDRERALGRSDLVFPVLYISVPGLDNEAIWRNHPVLSIIGQRQYVDWRPFRHEDIRAPAVRAEIERFCSKIVVALNRPWLSPEERRHADERAAEEAAAQAVRSADEAARRADEDALRQREIEERRLAAEETRQRAAEDAARRRADEEAQSRERERQAAALRRGDEEARRRKAEEESRRRAEAKASGAAPALAPLGLKVDVRALLMSIEGRIGRAMFWQGTLFCALIALLAIGVFLLALAIGLGNAVALVLGAIVFIPSVIASIVVGIKRLHDRNKSGWWIVGFYVVPNLISLRAIEATEGITVLSLIVLLASYAISIWALVELGCLRGTAGPNRYGEDPLANA